MGAVLSLPLVMKYDRLADNCTSVTTSMEVSQSGRSGRGEKGTLVRTLSTVIVVIDAKDQDRTLVPGGPCIAP